MPMSAQQPDPAEQLIDLLHSVTSCLESPAGENLAVCQKHLMQVIDLIQTSRQNGAALPPATREAMRQINSLRRQAESLLTQPGAASLPPTYRRDGSAELTGNGPGGFEMEL